MGTKENLLEIYKVEAEKYNKTRDIHWKINIAVWTVVILAIYGKVKWEIPSLHWCCEILIGLGYTALHFFFIYNIHGSLNRSLSRMHDMAVELIKPEHDWDSIGEKINPDDKTILQRYYWELLQILITALLVAVYVALKH